MPIAATPVWAAAPLSAIDRPLATVVSACTEKGIATRLARSSAEDHAAIIDLQDLPRIVDPPGTASLRLLSPAGQSAASVAFVVVQDHSKFIESLAALGRYIETIEAPLGAVVLTEGMQDVVATDGPLHGAEFISATIGGLIKITIIAMRSVRTRFPLQFPSQPVRPPRTVSDSLARRAEWFRRRTEPRS